MAKFIVITGVDALADEIFVTFNSSTTKIPYKESLLKKKILLFAFASIEENYLCKPKRLSSSCLY